MEGAKLKALKQVFPELRNFEGRFFGLFLAELQKKVEDWAIWARLELGKRKCYNVYRTDTCCAFCKNLELNDTCKKHPELGQTWNSLSDQEFAVKFANKPAPGVLKHPNTGEWYWCIKECPDYEADPEKSMP